MKLLGILLFFFAPFSPIFSEMHHHYINHSNIFENSFYWEKQDISSFKELLISWNAIRPKQGHYSIYVRVNTGIWSPWLLYAIWGSNFQKGGISTQKNIPVHVDQDTVKILQGELGHGFQIKIIAENGADISHLKSIHVCSSSFNATFSIPKNLQTSPSYLLKVKGLSQMALKDERKNRLCSPTSTTAIVRFLNKDNSLNPIEFAENVWDASFDIFGNWVFNVAEAYHQINNAFYSCWVERLTSFQTILDSLKKGVPVIISIRGPLSGSPLFYKNGHLLAIIGFNSKTKKVICMDPAFNKDEETQVEYKLDDLIKAWERRQYVSYIFYKGGLELENHRLKALLSATYKNHKSPGS